MPRSIREIAVVLILLGAALFILFSSREQEEAGLVGRAVHAALRPFQQAASGAHYRVKRFWNGYIALVDVQKENSALKEQNQNLRGELTMLRVQERENRRLRKLLSLKEHHDFPTAAAQVIGEDALGWYRALIIDRGSQDGVLPGMPANAPAGVVGRVSTTSGSVSKVMLITDPGLSLDCRVARTRDRGVLSGYLAKQCIVRYVDLGSGVKSGDEVVTSGLDGIFPRNLPVGTVDQVRKDSQGMFVEALVKPSVNFSELEEVLIILGARDGFDIRPGLDDKR